MIHGSTVSIGPILSADVPTLFRWSEDVETARLNEVYRPHDLQREETFWTNIAGDRTRVFFAIRRREDQGILGFVQITGIDPVHRSASIGIRIGETTERGKGLGRAALDLAVGYCWNWLNLSRLSLSVFDHNRAAIRLYEALGFASEGLLCRALFIDGAWIDLRLMALMRLDRAA